MAIHICEWMFLFTKDRKQKKQKPEGSRKLRNLRGSDDALKREKKIPAVFNNALIAETAATLAKRTKWITDYFSLRVGGWDLFSPPLSLP